MEENLLNLNLASPSAPRIPQGEDVIKKGGALMWNVR